MLVLSRRFVRVLGALAGVTLFASSTFASATLSLAKIALADGSELSTPTLPHRHGDRVYFVASDATNQQRLYETDGTNTGTVAIEAVPSGTVTRLGAISGGFVFVVDGKLFRSDGTAAGTVEVMTLPRTKPTDPNVSFTLVGSTGTIAIFSRSDSTTRIVRTDGTVAGTRDLSEDFVVPMVTAPKLRPLLDSGYLYFYGAAFARLYRTNGTILEFAPTEGTPSMSAEHSLLGCGGAVWRSTSKSPNGGIERITAAGAVDFGAAEARTPLGCAGNRIVFLSREAAAGVEPWSSDGTSGNRTALGDLSPSSTASMGRQRYPLPSIGGRALFRVCPDAELTACDVWTTDGTAVGTTKTSGKADNDLRELGRIGGRAYLHSGSAPQTIHVTDGTSFVDVPTPNAPALTASDQVWAAVELGPRLLYRAAAPDAGAALWVLDDPDALADGGAPDAPRGDDADANDASADGSNAGPGEREDTPSGDGDTTSDSGCSTGGGPHATSTVCLTLLGLVGLVVLRRRAIRGQRLRRGRLRAAP